MSRNAFGAFSTVRIIFSLLLAVCCLTGPAEAGFVKAQTWQWTEGSGFGFGLDTALSNSGDVALVNKMFLGSGECPKVFRRNPATGQWNEEVLPPSPSCGQETHAHLSGNGDVVVIATTGGGQIRTYVFNGATWQLAHSVPGNPNELTYASVLSDDGSTLFLSIAGPQSQYFIRALKRTASGWSVAQTLPSPNANIVWNLVVSADLQYLAGADPGFDGTVFLWRRVGTAWTLAGMLSGSPGGQLFGRDIAMSDDGSTMLITEGRSYDCAATLCAAVHVYVRQGVNWFWHQKLTPPYGNDETISLDPGHLALSGSGTVAVAGSWGAGCGSEQCSEVYVYRRKGLTWHAEQKFLSSPGPLAGYLFGTDVAVSGDAGTLLIGARYEPCESGTNQCGSAYLYEYKFNATPHTTPPCSGPLMGPGCFEIPMPAPGQNPFVPLGCEIVDCCPLCPLSTPVEWALTLDGAPVRELVVRLERLDPQQLARLSLRGPAQWVEPGVLRIFPGGEVTVSGFSVPRATLRWTVASPRMTFHSVVGANPGSGEIRLRVQQRTPQGRLSESVLVYHLTAPPP